MKKWFNILATVLGGLSVSACSTTGTPISDAKGTLLNFTEKVNGNQIELVYMVHPDMLRIDYGSGGNYTLFNRKTQTIYDISEADKKVVVIKGKVPEKDAIPEVLEAPSGVTITENASEMLSDGSSIHYRFIKNGETCLNVIAVSDLFPAVEVAMAEMADVRVNDPRLADIDPNSCEHVTRFYAMRKAPTLGFPVRMWSSGGYSRFMGTYRVQIDLTDNTEWHKLPEWY